MSASSQSVGSLIIDLRANVAQLQVDMDQVKDLVSKSSREMSSQMKSDMQDTRQTLALLSNDILVIPRALRGVIAESELARNAIMAMGNAFIALTFIDLAVKGFEKISTYLDDAQKKSAAEAKSTLDIANAAQNAVDATIKRAETLELIGKGEQDRAAIQAAFFEQEKQRNVQRLQALQSQLQARLALLKTYDNAPDATPDRAAAAEAGIDEAGSDSDEAKATTLSLYAKAVQDAKPELEALQKAIDDATAGAKANDLQLADYEKGLSLDRIKNEESIANAVVELRRKTAEDAYAAEKIGLDAYIMALKGTASKDQEIRLQGLYDTLAILEQDPSRNVEKIQQTETQVAVAVLQGQQKWTDILAKASEDRKKIIQDEAKANAEAFKSMADANKNSMLPADLATSFLGNGSPKLSATLGSFMQNQSQDLLGNTMKDAAAQGKLLDQAMEALLTPTQKYQVLQAEIIPLMDKYKDYPDVVKALTVELQKANPEFQKLQEASAEFGKDLSTEIENIAISGKSLHDFLLSILQDLEKIVLEAELLKPLQNFFSGTGNSAGGGLPSFLSSLFGIGGGSGAASAAGGDAGSSVANSIGGLFADGGNPPVGVPSIVGEEGPELFVPQSAGAIVPNGQYGGGTTYNISIDARGSSPGTAPAIQRAVQTALQENVRQSVAASIDYQRRR
jgi:hypothetical protein